MPDDIEPVEPAAAPASLEAALARNEYLVKELASARSEAAGYRTGNKGQMAKLHEAFGLKDGEDFSVVIERQKAATAEVRQLKVDLELERAFSRRGAKGNLVRAVLIDRGLMSTFDPKAEEFSQSIDDLVGEILVESPELKAHSLPARSGPDLPPGGSGAPPPISRADVASMSSAEVVEALNRGSLDQLLGRRR